MLVKYQQISILLFLSKHNFNLCVLNYDFERLEEIFGQAPELTQEETNFQETDFLHTQETYLADAEVDQDAWASTCDTAFQGFMDLETDKTGVMARDLLKHDVQEMYEVLDEYNKLGFGDPMTNKMRESINALVTEMRETISSKKGVKRPLGNVHYITDEIPGNKNCRRSYHSKDC